MRILTWAFNSARLTGHLMIMRTAQLPWSCHGPESAGENRRNTEVKRRRMSIIAVMIYSQQKWPNLKKFITALRCRLGIDPHIRAKVIRQIHRTGRPSSLATETRMEASSSGGNRHSNKQREPRSILSKSNDNYLPDHTRMKQLWAQMNLIYVHRRRGRTEWRHMLTANTYQWLNYHVVA